MKRILSTLSAIIAFTFAAIAQQGLEIGKIFGGKYISDPTVSEVVISGDQKFLTKHKLTALSTFKGDAGKYAPILQPLVIADGNKAKARNVRYKDGKLQYAFFALEPVDKNKKENRFIYYINNGNSENAKVILIYMAGNITYNRAESIIRSLAK